MVAPHFTPRAPWRIDGRPGACRPGHIALGPGLGEASRSVCQSTAGPCSHQAGRNLSRFRYHNAESFFLGIEIGVVPHPTDRLYQIGIVLQLGLSAHLLDVGFADAWYPHHIGLNVARSLAHANATGLGFKTTDMELLAAILSPYGKWRNASPRDVAPDFPFSTEELRMLTRALLDRVHQVTGHPRPRGWQYRLR